MGLVRRAENPNPKGDPKVFRIFLGNFLSGVSRRDADPPRKSGRDDCDTTSASLRACHFIARDGLLLTRTIRRIVAGYHLPPLRVLLPSAFSVLAMLS